MQARHRHTAAKWSKAIHARPSLMPTGRAPPAPGRLGPASGHRARLGERHRLLDAQDQVLLPGPLGGCLGEVGAGVGQWISLEHFAGATGRAATRPRVTRDADQPGGLLVGPLPGQQNGQVQSMKARAIWWGCRPRGTAAGFRAVERARFPQSLAVHGRPPSQVADRHKPAFGYHWPLVRGVCVGSTGSRSCISCEQMEAGMVTRSTVDSRPA
jgi:hypothetical protein